MRKKITFSLDETTIAALRNRPAYYDGRKPSMSAVVDDAVKKYLDGMRVST